MTRDELTAENEELRRRLEEAEATLLAIRRGEVDALVVSGENEQRVYTLESADHPYRVLVEAMQQGAVTLDTAGTIIYANSSFSQMVRRPHEKVLGESVQIFFAADDRVQIDDLLRSAHEGNRQIEVRLRPDDGAAVPVYVSSNPIHVQGASVICLIFTDLTEHHQNAHLIDTDRRKDEFLAMLAHELRNPLAPIANAVQTLWLINPRDQDVQWACEVIERQVQQMTRIVDDLLDVSRITRGKVKLKRIPLEVSAVVASAVETSRPLIETRKHKFHIELPAENLWVEGDPVRLSQVLTNLLNNAAKYTEDGGQITLSVSRAGDAAIFRVRDSGIGMPPEMLPRVFDLFTQVDRTIDRSQGGLGIGLTLVRTLVDLHGGTVQATSAGPGQGSEFLVSLPLTQRPPSGRNGSQKPFPVSEAADGQRILIVDDNVDSAKTMAMLLNLTGHQTAVVHDGPAAIEAAKRFSPSLVLLDLGLPGMDGYHVAQRLRGDAATARIVLAALTGYGSEEDMRRTKAAGFDYHLVKPVNFKSLQEVVASAGRIRR